MTSISTAAIGFVRPLEPEDRVRADFYALFARLFFAPPDAELLRTMGSAPLLDPEADAADFAIAWSRLAAAARVMDPDAAADEFEALFGGIGKSLISLFGSFYIGEDAPGAGGNFLVSLRASLAELGLGLKVGQTLPEDHICCVFETMRLLIAGDIEAGPHDITTQHSFFERFVAPWCTNCCVAIKQASVANLYKTVAECVEAFLAIELESLTIA